MTVIIFAVLALGLHYVLAKTPAGRVLYVSRILKWYREDFERAAGSLREYLIRNLTGDAAVAATDPAWKIDYLDYDWTLNDVM